VNLRTKTLTMLVSLAAALATPALARGPAGVEAFAARTPALQRTYLEWQILHEKQGGDRNVVVGLGYAKGLSTEATAARGLAALDLIGGKVQVTVTDLEGAANADVWLVDNLEGPGLTVAPEKGDAMVRLGRLEVVDGMAELAAELPARFLDGFEIDLVVVTRGDLSPLEGSLIFGTRSLFQRLYTRTRLGQLTTKAAAELLQPLVRQGAELFNEETFEGNSRTCASCHPAQNNFTIDAPFIATLPASDPLFVAEFDPNLSQLERPALMRQFGLILENVDGLEDPTVKFTMRSVPHTLAMRTSLTPTTADGSTIPPVERTGWSGDGAPNDGSLRQFAVGAVTQHFPKTLARQAGVDFRLPTEAELDAMEAFQLVLGRDAEVNLALVTPGNATVAQGKTIFLAADTAGGTVPAGKCNGCHNNAGANFIADGANRNFDTGVERMDHPARLVQNFPLDGGFGKNPNFLFDDDDDGVFETGTIFGNRTFNTTTLIEAADTPPFFHNNVAETLEDAVAFYSTASFAESGAGQLLAGLDSGGIGIQLTTAQSNAVAAFLRVLNTAENIRASDDFLAVARGASIADGKELIGLAEADTHDGVEVLIDGGFLHPNATLLLVTALLFEDVAEAQNVKLFRNLFIDAARAALSDAKADLGTGF
jgi:cytochrome c553